MGVHSAKAMVLGCLLVNIVGSAAIEEGSRPFAAETHGDDISESYCQFKGGCLLTPSSTQSQFIEAEPATDDPTQTVMACNGSSDRPAPQQDQRKALGLSMMVSA